MTEDQKILVTTHLKNILSGKVIPNTGLCKFLADVGMELQTRIEILQIIQSFNERSDMVFIVEGSAALYRKAVNDGTLYDPNIPHGAKRLRLVRYIIKQVEKGI